MTAKNIAPPPDPDAGKKNVEEHETERQIAEIIEQINHYEDLLNNTPFEKMKDNPPLEIMSQYMRLLAKSGKHQIRETKAAVLHIELMVKYVDKAIEYLEQLYADPMSYSFNSNTEQGLLDTIKLIVRRLDVIKYDTLEMRERLSLLDFSRETNLFVQISRSISQSEEIIEDTMKRKILRRPMAQTIIGNLKKNIQIAKNLGADMKIEEKKLGQLVKKIIDYLTEQKIEEKKQSSADNSIPLESYTRELKPKDSSAIPEEVVTNIQDYIRKLTA
jgi:hypothetical protein